MKDRFISMQLSLFSQFWHQFIINATYYVNEMLNSVVVHYGQIVLSRNKDLDSVVKKAHPKP